MDAALLGERRKVARNPRPGRSAGADFGLYRRGGTTGRAQGRPALPKRAQEAAQALRQDHSRERYLPHDEAPPERYRPPPALLPHSFRVTTITDLLEQGVPLEDVQRLAGHADPRTTGLYDRRKRKITRNIVERISV